MHVFLETYFFLDGAPICNLNQLPLQRLNTIVPVDVEAVKHHSTLRTFELGSLYAGGVGAGDRRLVKRLLDTGRRRGNPVLKM